MAGLSGFLKDLWERAEDVVSLDVVTMTGKLNFSAAAQAKTNLMTPDGELNATELRKAIGLQLKTADVRVVGMTHIAFDRDSLEYIDEDALGTPMEEAHHKNVATAQAARASIWKMATEWGKGLLRP